MLLNSSNMYLYPTNQILVPISVHSDHFHYSPTHLVDDSDLYWDYLDASIYSLDEKFSERASTSPPGLQSNPSSPKPVKLSKPHSPEKLEHVDSELMDVDLTSPVELGKYDTLTLNPMDDVGDDDFEFFKPKSSTSGDGPIISTPAAIPDLAHTPLPQTPYYGGSIFSPPYYGHNTPGAQMFSPSPMAMNDIGSPVVSPRNRVDTFLSPPATSPYAKQSTPYFPGKAYDTPKMYETAPISLDLVLKLTDEDLRLAKSNCPEQWIPFKLNLRMLEEENYGPRSKWHYQPSPTSVRVPKFRLSLVPSDADDKRKTEGVSLDMTTLLPDRMQFLWPMMLHRQPVSSPDIRIDWEGRGACLYALEICLDQLMEYSKPFYTFNSDMMRSIHDHNLIEETRHHVSEIFETASEEMKNWTLEELSNLGGMLN
jgi:hypothetical protein